MWVDDTIEASKRLREFILLILKELGVVKLVDWLNNLLIERNKR